MNRNGHEIVILHNDARYNNEDRLQFHFSLHCGDCETESNLAGAFPENFEDAKAALVEAKMYTIGKFITDECV